MGIVREETVRHETLREVARKMMLAARTAPKARGVDTLIIALIEGEDIRRISGKMKEIGGRCGMAAFARDAENILACPVMVLLGTRIRTLGLKNCGMCGFPDCGEKEKHPGIPCALNSGDLGIAIGSAVSVAADHRVDNRIMYTAGQAALALGLLGEDVKIAYGIPLSAAGKNPFFDRKP